MNTQQTPHPKCSGCKCYWKPDETDVKSSGLIFRTCRKCRERRQDNKIKYDNVYYYCACGGSHTQKHERRHIDTNLHRDWLKTQI